MDSEILSYSALYKDEKKFIYGSLELFFPCTKFLATAFASEYHLMDSTLVECEPFGAASREPTNWLHARFESSIVR